MKLIEDNSASRGDPAPAKARGGFTFSHWSSLTLPAAEGRAGRRTPVSVGVLDRAAALIGIVILSPVLLLLALVIKINSPGGSIIYRQERVGLDRRRVRPAPSVRNGTPERRRIPAYGQAFHVYKFRTMIPDAEKHTGPVWAKAYDPRITRVGRILRKLRMDEIPQLYNVLRGEMRLIGPRPERPHFVARLCEVIPDYAERLQVPPGITGLAQVEREYDSSVEDVRRKVMYDVFYVRHWSRLLDTKILITTIDVVLRGRGAR